MKKSNHIDQYGNVRMVNISDKSVTLRKAVAIGTISVNSDVISSINNKLNKKGDVLIFVEAKRKDIQKRLKKREHFNETLNRNLKSLQLPLTIKKKLSNFVIKNTFNAKRIKNDVKHIKTEILNI